MGMKRAAEVPTPECDKRSEILGEKRAPNDLLTEFWDWLRAEGLRLASYGEDEEYAVDCPSCRVGTGFDAVSTGRDVTQLRGRRLQLATDGSRHGLSREEADAYRHTALETLPACPQCNGETRVWRRTHNPDVLTEHHESPERLFSRFFGLDADLIEAEKQALLRALAEDDLPVKGKAAA